MKEQFVAYLKSIDLTEPIIKRIDEIHQFYETILSTKLDDEILDIFVTDYITKDETREYENIWLFSKKYFMEAKLFIKQDDFDICPISRDIVYLQVKKQDYDFVNSNQKSRLSVTYVAGLKGRGELKASKENCNYLKEIYIRYMLPNLSK
jgi:hypothetical protein